MGEKLNKTVRGTIIAVFVLFLALFSQVLLSGSVFPAEFFSFGGFLALVIFLIFFMAFSFID